LTRDGQHGSKGRNSGGSGSCFQRGGTNCSRHDGRVIRTKANPSVDGRVQERCECGVGRRWDIGFIPAVASGFDAMFCIAKLIEMLTIQERSLNSSAQNCLASTTKLTQFAALGR